MLKIASALVIVLTSTSVQAQEFVGSISGEIDQATKEALFVELTKQLSDPYSAKLHDVAVGDISICGFVNAKNQFGAYTGLLPFSFSPGNAHLVIATKDTDPANQFKRDLLEIFGCRVTP